MNIPEGAREVVGALRRAGYEAYLVGGCVRDMLLAEETGAGAPAAHDWDVCTNASPEETKRALAPRRTLDAGLKHGTVTVLAPDGLEVPSSVRARNLPLFTMPLEGDTEKSR